MAKTPAEILKKYADDVSKIDPAKFNYLLEDIPKQIRIRTRLGKGLEGTLKALSPLYIKRRESLELSSETTPAKSNLTQTGQMLYDIIGVRSGYRFSFFFSNDDSNNKAVWAREKGRAFFGLLEFEKSGIQRKVSATMRDAIRDLFKG